jgi:hypothetical protein
MLKAGLIGAGLGFLLALVTSLITPLCNPCAALVLGLGVGVLAGVWERPTTSRAGARVGAQAGAIATLGSLVGQMVGAVTTGFIVGPEAVTRFARQFDIQVPITRESYWVSLLGGSCVCGVVDVAIGAGLGALGGILWYELSGKNRVPPIPPAGTG